MPRSDLDRYITGNNGEDQLEQHPHVMMHWRSTLEGSDPQQVVRTLSEALSATDAAVDALQRIEIHARDYVGRESAHREDRRMLTGLITDARRIADDLHAAIEHVLDQTE